VGVSVEVDGGTIIGVNVGVGTTVGLGAALTVGVLAGNDIGERETEEQADDKTASRIKI
jgi:hypothetical protein